MVQQKHAKHVLVTGGAGYIGSTLLRLLLSQGYKVSILDAFLYGRNSLAGIEQQIRIVEGDTRDALAVTEALTDVDAVVHFAEIVGDPACGYNPKQARSINLDGTQLVAKIAKQRGVRTFIYASSCSVYGLADSNKLSSEQSALNPVSLYAELKVDTERQLTAMADKHFIPTILRFATAYGLSFRPRFDLVVNTITAHAAIDRRITVQGQHSWRPFVHVMDIGRVVLSMLQHERTSVEVFNVGHGSQNHTILEIAEMVLRRLPSTTLTIEGDSADQRSYRVGFSKLHQQTGFTPVRTIASAIEEQLQYLAVHPDYSATRFSNIKSVMERY